MKRILLALTVLLSVQLADAQVKTPEAAKKAVDAAEAASKDAKKATKVATWLKLATAYMDAYNAPKGSAWLGASKQELQLVMGSEKPVATENVVLAGDPCVKEVYADKELYFNQNGQLVMINVTKPLYADALGKALEAYRKAYEVDAKKTKVKDITAGLQTITQNYLDDGMNSYMFEDFASASKLFGKAAEASASEPLSQTDTVALYNAGFTAWMVKDYARAEEYFQKCMDINYYYEGGEVFAKLSDISWLFRDADNIPDSNSCRDTYVLLHNQRDVAYIHNVHSGLSDQGTGHVKESRRSMLEYVRNHILDNQQRRHR